MWLVLLFVLGATACSSADAPSATPSTDDPAPSSSDPTDDDGAAEQTPRTTVSPATGRDSGVPRAGDPLQRPDGSVEQFEEGMIVVIDDVSYVVQAADYEGPPVLHSDQSSPAPQAPPPPPDIDLPEAPGRLGPGLSNDQLMALFADMHGPTSSIAEEMNRVAIFPAVLDSDGAVVIESQEIEILERTDGLLSVDVQVLYDTAATMAEATDTHRQKLSNAGHDPRDIEVATENGVETSRTLRSEFELPEAGLDRVSVRVFARPSEVTEGGSFVYASARYTVAPDWVPFQQLLGWSELEALTDAPPSQIRYASSTDPQAGVLNAYMHTRWVAPESVDEAVAIALERAPEFDPSEFDQPDMRHLRRDQDDMAISAREHWEGNGTELTLHQLRPILVPGARPTISQPTPVPEETGAPVGELVALSLLQPDGSAELSEQTTLGELATLLRDVTNAPAGTDSIAELNRLAPFPRAIEFPPDSSTWLASVQASYVGDTTDVQQIEYSVLVSVFDSNEQELYDFFVTQMDNVGATTLEENVTRTTDGEVEDAEIRFVVDQDGILLHYDVDLGRNRFEITVTYSALTQPNYVELMATYVTIDLPHDGPLVASSVGNDSGPLTTMVALGYDQDAYPSGDAVLVEMRPLIEENGAISFESSTSLRYSEPGSDVRVNRDDWGFGPGTISFEISPASN